MLLIIKKLLAFYNGLKDKNKQLMNYFYIFSERYGRDIAYLSFAFIFIYFGLQKPLPVISPVDTNLALISSHLGISSSFVIYFVGLYEIFIGLLFLFRLIKHAFWFFLAHQLTSFLTLLIISKNAFQPPWLIIRGFEIPWALNSYSAFVFKNLLFISCFILLFKEEYKSK